MILDLKQCDLVDTPYFNPQISYSSDLEEDVQYPQNLMKSKQKVYHSMENNEQDAKVKHPSQFYANYWCSLKYHCVMAELIFSTAPIQVENEPNFSIAGYFSRAQRSSLTIKKLAMLNFNNKNSQLHEKFKDKDLK